VLEVIPTFAERPLYGKKAVVWSLAIATFLSFIVYIHHMFTTGVDPALRKAMTITTEMISIPFGVIYLCLIATMWKGRIRFGVPMLFAIGFIILFLVGGLTGVFLSSVAIDYGMQGSYWVVAHFHYALLGGGVWGVLAALYFWFPKLTGKMFNERMGRTHFWMGFIGFNLLFMSMFFFGKMPRRIYTYSGASDYATALPLGVLNTLSTLGAFMFAAGIGLMIGNFLWSWKRGPYAGHDPWGADSLEWTLSSPPPQHNFTKTPVMVENPLDVERSLAAKAASVSLVTETKP
jgi:heme/copper-type cytochrome/quinol oxidase subunit 1